MKVRLVKTCDACPEQYDAYLGTKRIGYLRLRHGHFTVSYPKVGGDIVLACAPRGDGIFEPDERDTYLTLAVTKLLKRHAEEISSRNKSIQWEIVEELNDGDD